MDVLRCNGVWKIGKLIAFKHFISVKIRTVLVVSIARWVEELQMCIPKAPIICVLNIDNGFLCFEVCWKLAVAAASQWVVLRSFD